MITGKLLGLLAGVIVVCIALSGLVGWGVASATLAGSHPKTVAGAKGSNGTNGSDGSDGSNGSNGKDGSAGANGANGATGDTGSTGAKGAKGANGAKGASGATGTAGAAGAAGPVGPIGVPGAAGQDGNDGAQGPAGPTGASAPSFATTSASGTAVLIGLAQGFGNIIGGLDEIPAGPALVGFTVVINDPNGDFPTCSLVNILTNQIVASAPPVTLSLISPTPVSMTQVITLTAPALLQLQCSPMFSFIPATYTGLSVYAISFATS